jgi:hypothetical protein
MPNVVGCTARQPLTSSAKGMSLPLHPIDEFVHRFIRPIGSPNVFRHERSILRVNECCGKLIELH